jgi:hypothetical protein
MCSLAQAAATVPASARHPAKRVPSPLISQTVRIGFRLFHPWSYDSSRSNPVLTDPFLNATEPMRRGANFSATKLIVKRWFACSRPVFFLQWRAAATQCLGLPFRSPYEIPVHSGTRCNRTFRSLRPAVQSTLRCRDRCRPWASSFRCCRSSLSASDFSPCVTQGGPVLLTCKTEFADFHTASLRPRPLRPLACRF